MKKQKAVLGSRLIAWAVGLSALALAGCSGSATPQLIGAHPKAGQPTYIPTRTDYLAVSTAHLSLEASDPDAAARRATQLAYDLGGYRVGSQTWYAAEDKHVTLTLAVPVPQFEAARNALRGLGRLLSESVSGEVVIAGDGRNEWNTFSHLVVQFQPPYVPSRLPAWPSLGWNPLRTLQSAFDVSFSIFSFLIDAAIWIAVILGPFVLLGLGLRRLFQRMRPR